MSASRAHCIWLLGVALAVSPLLSAKAAPNSADTPLTTVDAIQRLSPEEADRQFPVQIRAVVTFSQAKWGNMFVEDATGGIYCDPGLLTNVPPAGQHVELSGITASGSYLPIINVRSVHFLESKDFPPARPVTATELWQGKFDSDFVRISGFITHSEIQTNPFPFTKLHIVSEGLTAYVSISSLPSFPLDELPGTQIEATGVFGPTLNRLGQIASVGILAARPEFVRFVDRANDVLSSLPLVTIRNTFTMTNQLARIRGTVMLSAKEGFWIGDGTNGINVAITGAPVQRGELVEIAGLVRKNDGETRLRLYRIISRTNGPPLVPIAVTAADLSDPARYGQLLTVQGEFLHRVANTNGDVLVLREGDRTFEARIRHGVGRPPEDLAARSLLSVTGILRTPSHNHPRLLISAESDLRILSSAPWPLRYTLTVVTILAFLLTCGLACLGLAHHRLREANARVRQADKELRDLNAALEKRIHLRTAELEKANAQLNADIAARNKQEIALRESEERFATAFHSSPAIIAITSFPDGRIIDANERMVELSGYTREELIGRTSLELGMWANPRQREDLMRQLARGGDDGGPRRFVRDFEFDGVNRAGRRFILLTSIDRIELAGQPCMLSIIQDITERKQAEDSLRESEERFAKAFRASPAIKLIERQSDSTCIDLNGRFTEVMGYSREEVIGRTSVDLGLWVNPARRHYVIDGVHAGLQVRDFECEVRNKAGERLTMLISVERIVLGGEPCLLSIYHDITARKEAEQLRDGQTQVLEMIAQGAPLEQTLDRLVRTIESQSEGLLCSIQLLDANGEGVRHGAAPNLPPDFYNKSVGFLLNPCVGSGPPTRRREMVIVEDILTDPSWASQSDAAIAAGLRSCWSSPIFDAQRRLLGTFAIYSSKSGRPSEKQLKLIETATHTAAICIIRAQTEEALRCSEERFQYAMRGANDGLWDWNLLTNEVYYSPRWKSMIGYEPNELPGHLDAWKQRVHPEDLSRTLTAVKEIFAKGLAMYQAEFRMRHKHGNWVNILSRGFVVHDVHGTPVRMVGTHVDITERKKEEEARASLEVQLRQSQKMEAIGTLAGGIAHDFNNILGVIIGYTELVMRDLPDNPATHGSLEHVLKASHRAKELVRQILTFSRHEEFQRTHLRLDAILTETIALLRATLPASLEIIPRIILPVPPVSGNETLIQQVLVNLATNAAQAIGRQSGQIAITIEGWRIDETSPEREGNNLRPGYYARLTVQDSGPGIDSAIIDRIFEPFFTTKGPGEGTGLGLSVVHGIVQSHDGAIRVHSRLGLGSTFEVYLPATAEETPPPSPDQPESGSVRGSERILLVDDEASLLKIGERFLREAGYEVTTCLHPDTALELFRHSPWNFDLVITDYSMPGQSGLDLGARIRELRPDLPMIICTGYGAGLTKERARRVGFHNVLHKPVGLEEFGQAIREALEQAARQA